MLRFVRAFRETLDWMYADPEAIKMYAEAIKVPVAIAKTAVEKFQPKDAKQFDRILDIEGIMAGAVSTKFPTRRSRRSNWRSSSKFRRGNSAGRGRRQ